MGSKSSSAPAPDPALIAAQIKSMGIQDSAIQEVLKQSADMLPYQKEQMQFALDSGKAAYDQSQTAYAQSQADRDWMLNRRGSLSGLQDTLVNDAKNFNTDDRAAELAGQANADVTQAFSSARDQNARAMARTGVNPSSGRFLAMGNQTAIAQAAASAGASNKARSDARMEGYALTDRATNALAGYPAMGLQATSSGAGYGMNGLTTASAGLTNANAGLAGMNSGFGTAGQMAGQLGSNASGMYGAMGSYKNGQDNIASSNNPFNTIIGAAAGIGTAYGLKKFG